MILKTVAAREALLARSRTVAMVGASANPERPSYDVFRYLRSRGRFDVTPINPTITEIDGVRAFPTLTAYAAALGKPDIVDVFRRPDEVLSIVEEAIAIGARAIWFQNGVVNEAAIALADAANLDVVVDRCLKVESASFDGGLSIGTSSRVLTPERIAELRKARKR